MGLSPNVPSTVFQTLGRRAGMHHLPMGVALAISLAFGIVVTAVAGKDQSEGSSTWCSSVLGDVPMRGTRHDVEAEPDIGHSEP